MTSEYHKRFAGIQRLYGTEAAKRIKGVHICVIGVGGVGSWAAEALARSGVNEITLIDNDCIELSNTNRQIHTTLDTLGRQKTVAMAERLQSINPTIKCHEIDDFITVKTYEQYLSGGYDYIIDAIDSIKFKTLMVNHCKRNKIPLIMTGGAGGLSDPSKIKIDDLSRTYNDPLASKVRSTLRKQFGFPKDTKKKFGIECVFSSQQQVYPKEDGTVSHQKPGIHGVSL
ncbi:MAG: tRNA threonylcarbamoyladenosine dehydratase, partial [Gammaproteobacteria bacterium]|nr:tRNA threonylcarbamoyladenosine dehydratase [Gammaproteobacteria bacterium]